MQSFVVKSVIQGMLPEKFAKYTGLGGKLGQNEELASVSKTKSRRLFNL